jgi:hypothetical protein
MRFALPRGLMLWIVFSLTLVLPSACWAANALIVHDGTPGIEADVLGNLTAKLAAATFTVTPSVGVPGGSLATYTQVWDIRFNNTTPLTGGDIAAYITYMAGGGSLFVMGENMGFATRNNSIVSLVASAGGGTITPVTAMNVETVQPPFTGPNAITTMTFLAASGIVANGSSGFVTRGSDNIGAAIVFGAGSMTNAPAGTLIVVFDVNFLQAGADAASQAFTKNLIGFLAAPVPIPSSTPAPPSLILALIGAGGVAFSELRRRRKARAA